MLYIKYERSMPCSFKQDFWKTFFFTLWPTDATNWNNLNNFGRGPPRDHSCEVWSKSNERFQRRRCSSKKVYGPCTTDDGQRPITIAHPEHFVLRWAKKKHKCFPMHRSAKFQACPNVVDFLWSCEGLRRGPSFVFSRSDHHLYTITQYIPNLLD